MKWIMILVMSVDLGGTVSIVAEFNSHDACMSAVGYYVKQKKVFIHNAGRFEKGKEK
jgi:hypothetical protein